MSAPLTRRVALPSLTGCVAFATLVGSLRTQLEAA